MGNGAFQNAADLDRGVAEQAGHQSAAVVRDLFMQRLPAALSGKAVR
jgi:hypothetical protein